MIAAFSVALVGSSHDDDDISSARQHLAEEDPTTSVPNDPLARDLDIEVTSDAHLQVTLARLRRRFNVVVTAEVPSVECFGTIRTARDIEGRPKKQRGGRG